MKGLQVDLMLHFEADPGRALTKASLGGVGTAIVIITVPVSIHCHL
jgi:hypothetical protein